MFSFSIFVNSGVGLYQLSQT